MSVENIKSLVITNMETVPQVITDGAVYGAPLLRARDTITLTQTTGSATSTYKALRLPSTARLVKLDSYGDGTLATPSFTIGATGVNQPTVTSSAASIGSAKAITASTAEVVLFGNVYSAAAPKQLWELAGYTSDPGGNIDILFTITTATTAAGILELKATYLPK